jgi:hypothetical protein
MVRWLMVTAAALIASVVTVEAVQLVYAHTKLGHTYLVDQRNAWRFTGFINQLESEGRPIRFLGCFSRWGHVHHSLHHTGNACDIEQTGWGRTSYARMYRIRWMAHRWGLRDGCEFGDCGHIDTGNRWRDGAPAGQYAQVVGPAAQSGFKLASTDIDKTLNGWPRVLPAAKKTTTAHRHSKPHTATIWRTVPKSDKCVNVGERLSCIAKAQVNLGEES